MPLLSAGRSKPRGAIADTMGGYRVTPARGPVSELEAENSRLRRELIEAKLDVEILRKATAYFARGSR